MSTYNGFSTIGNYKKFKLTDFELAKRDLLNYLSVRKGERVMYPNFGTVIWNMIFEKMTPENQQIITDDITRIVNYDPRLAVETVNVNTIDHGLQIQIQLTYVPTNQTDIIFQNFTNQ